MQDRRFWEPDTVLQLGGVKQSSPRSHNLLPHKPFKGRLRNIVLNKQVYDLAAPLEAVNSSPGCVRKGTACSSPVPCDFPCVSDPWTPSCDCPPAHQDCGKDVHEHFFHPGGHIQYLLPHSLHPQRTHFQATLRTRNADSIILRLSSKARSESIHLQVRHGLLTVSYNLSDGPNTVTLPDHEIYTGE
ncbi:putative neural-cadherin 2 [Spea bombifrons]|uniref:putative neural-cadherin 2 n=1 Tax=Spea bombifrons TaxID=233779 RepID=UPI00234BAEEE|nr:putative neural-cadherin 2 [Spea bombifrons]